MRSLACALCRVLYTRMPEQTTAALRELLKCADTNLFVRPLVDTTQATDPLETSSLLHGHLALLREAQPALVRHALPYGAKGLSDHLLCQLCNAPASVAPLDLSIYKTALELAIELGVHPDELQSRLFDDSPVGYAQPYTPRQGTLSSFVPTDAASASAAPPAGGASPTLHSATESQRFETQRRGELFSGRFRSVLLPALAKQPAVFGAKLMDLAPHRPHAFLLLLALLEHHVGKLDQPAATTEALT